MNDLFRKPSDETLSNGNAPHAPLADRLRPQTLDDIVGQDHIIGTDTRLREQIESGQPSSMIFWGPPGCGKTTLARIISGHADMRFVALSAIFSGVKELRQTFDEARHHQTQGAQTLLFVDEIHHFNKSQQDAFLPVVEDGTIILIGATTENPSFQLNAALLSRCDVVVLERLEKTALQKLLDRVEKDIQQDLPLTKDGRQALIAIADGDGRYLINAIERLLEGGLDKKLDRKAVTERLQKRAPVYDQHDDSHYNLISSLHKAVRGSDTDAALYWLARMLTGGEDPRFIARRMLRMAYEDIGLADPQMPDRILTAWQTYERLGSPEGELALAQGVIDLSLAPKSNAVYTAYKSAMKLAKDTGSLSPPKHAMNAPTQLMKDIGHTDGYIYDHDTPNGYAGLNYMPEDMQRPDLYAPVERGQERELKKRLAYFTQHRKDQ